MIVTTATQGGEVAVVPGVIAFDRVDFEAWIESDDLAVAGRLVLDDPPSRYLLDRFTVQRSPDAHDGITATEIRSVPIDRIVAEILSDFGVRAETDWDSDEGSRLRAKGIKDETALRRVAEVYLAAGLRGSASLAAVAQFLGCSTPTASRWIAQAKDAGHLRVASRMRRG